MIEGVIDMELSPTNGSRHRISLPIKTTVDNAQIFDSNFAEYQIIEAPNWESGIDRSKMDLQKTMAKRLLHWGPIIAIGITLIIGIAATYLHLLWWPLQSIWSSLDLILFLSFNYLTLINLSRSAYFGPGYVPNYWTPPHKENESRLQYCRICEGYKVPRSHHCSKCGRCVLKMDHHCPWINNCVGHRNHALFVRFLAAATLGCIHAAIIIGSSLYRFLFQVWYFRYGDVNHPTIMLSIYFFTFSIFAFGLALGVIVSVGFLLGLQLKAIMKNRTGIEDYIVDKANVRERDNIFIYPYNLGWRRNISDVLGTWDGLPQSDGVWWPVVSSCTQFTFSEEQLEQKRCKRENAYEIVIAKNFDGGYCAPIKFGLKVFFCQPWTDEKRVAVKVGERWLVTRVHRHWLYGCRMDDDYDDVFRGKTQQNSVSKIKTTSVRGWLPRICALKS